MGEDDYYGFILDKDQRYLFENFWVTHNSGKTITFVKMTVDRKVPTLILVNTQELASQAINSFVRFTNLKEEQIGYIGDGRFELSPVTVGLHQTMHKLTDSKFGLVNQIFGQIIADEVLDKVHIYLYIYL